MSLRAGEIVRATSFLNSRLVLKLKSRCEEAKSNSTKTRSSEIVVNWRQRMVVFFYSAYRNCFDVLDYGSHGSVLR